MSKKKGLRGENAAAYIHNTLAEFKIKEKKSKSNSKKLAKP